VTMVAVLQQGHMPWLMGSSCLGTIYKHPLQSYINIVYTF